MPSEDQKKLNGVLQRFEANTAISSANKSYIKDFYNYSIERGLGLGRRKILLQESIAWAELLKKDFKRAKKEDIRAIVAKLMDRNDLAGQTKLKKITVLKQFYKHLLGNDEDYPAIIKWTRQIKFKSTEKKSTDMITKEDLETLLKACLKLRDAVLVYFLWETGVRAGELLAIKLGDLKDEGTHFTVEVDGKTGRRNVPVIESIPYLKQWLNEHPLKHDKTAPLFFGISNNKIVPLDHRGFSAIFKRIAVRAGFTKPVNPHNFRHSSATIKAASLPTAILCRYYGWAQGSSMPATYLHISNEQTTKEVLKLYGVEKNAKPEPVKLAKCANCNTDNIPSNILCHVCGRALDANKAVMAGNTMIEMQKQINDMQALLKMPTETKERRKGIRRAIRKVRIKQWARKWTKKTG